MFPKELLNVVVTWCSPRQQEKAEQTAENQEETTKVNMVTVLYLKAAAVYIVTKVF